MRPIPVAVVVVALALIVSGPGAAAQVASRGTTLQGRVTLRRSPPPPAARPDVSGLGMPTHTHEAGDGDRRRSVVFLETAPRGAFDAGDEPRARIDQRNETFVPRLLAIVAGTIVDFPNSDVTYHNVFSFSRPRAFDLGRYAAGRSRSVRFNRPGIVRVFCDIHSHMSAHILVFAHRYFAVTDEDGRYRIDDVPPGSYSVAVWHESETEPQASRRITTPENGGTMELDFTIGQ